jgi:hypothetical protein
MGDNFEGVKNMKLLLCAFEHLSGLKINFHKHKPFAMAMIKIMPGHIPKSLDVARETFRLNI